VRKAGQEEYRSVISAVLPTYNRADLAFERGEDVYLYTADGTRYLDFTAGIAVDILGHAHPYLVEVLTEQAKKLWHVSNIYRIPGQERLGERLAANTFADTTFFCNSGAEAVETGIKMIRKYHHHAGNPERYRIIATENAFHGRTLTTIFAAGQQKLVEGFGPAVPGFDHVPFGNLNELRAAITDETAGILVEPVQGEGGINPASEDYLRGLRAVADEFDLILMYDEIQCGMGRTGKLFAHEWAGDAAPDVMAVAKGLGGGFPVGACLATERAASGMVVGTHGSTFGGNPLAMAVANGVLDLVLKNGFMEHVLAVSKTMHAMLDDMVARFPNIFVEARGKGLMVGLRCAEDVVNAQMVAALRSAGLLSAGAGANVVRFVPPLIITDAHIAEAAAIIEQVAGSWPAADAGTA
jgi:acetylornithine/N-succinyldiaminopimelate aminotransferase